MILIRFAISIFALTLLGLAFSYSAAPAHAEQEIVSGRQRGGFRLSAHSPPISTTLTSASAVNTPIVASDAARLDQQRAGRRRQRLHDQAREGELAHQPRKTRRSEQRQRQRAAPDPGHAVAARHRSG